MANNPYVNKVQKADGTTIIDISDTTATASDVASGKYFYTAAGAKTQGTATGGSGTAIIEDTLDANGGTIRTITTTDEAYLGTKSITANGTYTASTDDLDGYSSVTVNVSGGGQYAWLGENAEKVGTVINKVINLQDDTTYDSWTASTTAGIILAASTDPDYTLTADLVNYDYYFVTKGILEPVYVSGTPMTRAVKKSCQYAISFHYGYPSQTTYSNVSTDTASSVSLVNNSMYGYTQYYYNNVGSLQSWNANFGPMYMNTLPSIQNGTFSDGTCPITYKIPAFYAKCDSSRFPTDKKEQVDSANTNYYYTVDLYRVPHGKSWITHLISEMCAELNAT